MILRRLPIVVALYRFIPSVHTWREAVFTGWFGPIGVGAIFYSMVALENVPADGPNAHAREVLTPVVYFMVLSSVIAHGITIPLFYIGTFATRTLTRTSEAGTQVMRIPKIEKLFGSKSNPVSETDLGDGYPELPIDVTKQGAHKHTAITIITPASIPHRGDISETVIPSHGRASPATSSDSELDRSEEFLPSSRRSSFTCNDKLHV